MAPCAPIIGNRCPGRRGRLGHLYSARAPRRRSLRWRRGGSRLCDRSTRGVSVGVVHAGAAMLSLSALPFALGVAVLSSALPYSLEMHALTRLPARTVGILVSVEPAMGALLDLVPRRAFGCVPVASNRSDHRCLHWRGTGRTQRASRDFGDGVVQLRVECAPVLGSMSRSVGKTRRLSRHLTGTILVAPSIYKPMKRLQQTSISTTAFANAIAGKSTVKINIEDVLKAKANSLAVFCCLTDDKRCDTTSLFDELLDCTNDPDVARQLVRLLDSFDDCAALIMSVHSDDVNDAGGKQQAQRGKYPGIHARKPTAAHTLEESDQVKVANSA